MPKFVLSLLLSVSYVVLSLPSLASPLPSEQAVLRLYTEHSPPGEYQNAQGDVSGATVDFIKLLLQRLDQPATIELLPWARALELAKSQPNSGIFETVRNTEREHYFKWVGPLKVHSIGLYGRSDNFSASQSHASVGNKYLACEYRDSVHVNSLKRLGFTEGRNLILTVNHGDCFNLLIKGRVQLIVLNEAGILERRLQIQQKGYDLVQIQPLSEVKLYLALSADTKDGEVARWQQALEDSYRDGSMRRLYQRVYSEQMISRLEAFALENAAAQKPSARG